MDDEAPACIIIDLATSWSGFQDCFVYSVACCFSVLENGMPEALVLASAEKQFWVLRQFSKD